MQVSANTLVRIAFAAVPAMAFALSASASAQEVAGWEAGDFSLKAGVATIMFDSSADVAIGGAPVDGGSLSLSNGTTASFEIEFFMTPSLSTSVNFGIPMETTVSGEGTLAPAGEAGRVKYGIGAATLRYHLNTGSAFTPFLGAGVGHLFIFDEKDGSLTNLKVDDAWAPVIQGGADYRLSDHLGLYANVSYAPLKTDGRGEIFAAPAAADVTLNPTVIQGGVSYSF